jgi:large subunit ribosomal protein L25
MTTVLQIEKREDISVDAVRSAGKVPAVVYGPKQEAMNIAVDAQVFQKTLEEAGESTIITLEGAGDAIEVLIHDVAFHPVKGGVQHVDFYAIERGKELTVTVALEFEGEAPAEDKGLNVNHVLHEIEVTTRPSLLPSHITVDVSGLVDEDSHILVKDLKVAEGVKIDTDPEQVVVNVSLPREEEPEEPTEAVDMNAIEVEEKGKGEEDDAEAS